MSEQSSLNVAIETIPKDVRPQINSLIELTVKTAREYSDSPKMQGFKIAGFDPLYIAATGLNLKAWKNSLVKPAELLEQALTLPPNTVLLGFNISGSNWPVFEKEHSDKKEGKVLGESQLKEIYIALGGDRQKADKMFPIRPAPTSQ
jgi:hypothetical protein